MNDAPDPAERSFYLGAVRSRGALDADYRPSRFVASMADTITAWREGTDAAKAGHSDRFEALSYGADERDRIDLYRPGRAGLRAGGPAGGPVLVFIHGGFWSALSTAESGFVAPGWTAAGVHVAVLDYTLAPAKTLTEITAQVVRGVTWLIDAAPRLGLDPARIVLAGHSAGAHLAAMASLRCKARPAGLVLVSGVFDLSPVAACYVGDTVRITPAEVATLSPALLLPDQPAPTLVTVGENEPLGFHEQSRAMAWHWRNHGCAEGVMLLPDRNHFSILDDLGDPGSALGRRVARLLA